MTKPTHTYEPKSTIIAKIEWWREGGSESNPIGTLAVTLTGGKTYRYADVLGATYQNFVTAASAGQFFTRRIKGNYKLVED